MTSTVQLYWHCLAGSQDPNSKFAFRAEQEERRREVVAVPHSLITPLFATAKESLLSLLTSAFENKVVYASPASRTLAKTPKDFYMPSYEDVELTTSDGKKIHGWLIKRPKEPKSVVTIIHFHGNACNISHMLYDALGMFQKVKANILLIDYRGYGLSHGSPSQEGLLLDAEAALDYVHNRHDVCDPEKIFVFGRSLGGAVAIALAEKHQARVRRRFRTTSPDRSFGGSWLKTPSRPWTNSWNSFHPRLQRRSLASQPTSGTGT